MVSCSLWLRCCCTFPSQHPPLPPSAGSPVLVLCTWASLQGLGSQPSPAPNTGICSCPSPCWWTAEGAPRGRAPSPGPEMLLVFPWEREPSNLPIPPRADTVGVWTPGLGSHGTQEVGGGGSFSKARRAVFVRYLNQVEVSTWSLGQCVFLKAGFPFFSLIGLPRVKLAQLRWFLFAHLHPT